MAKIFSILYLEICRCPRKYAYGVLLFVFLDEIIFVHSKNNICKAPRTNCVFLLMEYDFFPVNVTIGVITPSPGIQN